MKEVFPIFKQPKEKKPPKPLKRTAFQRATKKSRDKASKDAAWSRAVRERDGFRCQWPDHQCTELDVHAHHIFRRSTHPDLKYDASVGITLCRQHHAWVHHNVEQAQNMGLLSEERYENKRRTETETNYR